MMKVDTSRNSSFSTQLPGLQLAIDSTSLGEFKTCPRKYYYSVVLGREPHHQSVHLTFGLLMHGGRERYDHGRSSGLDHDQALALALRWTLVQTWNKELSRGWISDHNAKNRETLVRSIIWYLDGYGATDPLETVQLANGKPAVELSFSFDTGLRHESTGEPILFCGHLDRIARLNGVPYIVDLKTTGSTISPRFFDQFTPNNQMSMYALAGRVAFGEPIQALIIDGLQVAVGFTRALRGMVQRTVEYTGEWLAEASWWARRMEESAVAGHWPMNDRSCDMYGGCPFRGVCSKPPGGRERWLDVDFKPRTWDPLQRRGDI